MYRNLYTEKHKKGAMLDLPRPAPRLVDSIPWRIQVMTVTLPDLTTPANPTVHYARLYDALENYLVRTKAGTMFFLDHDSHVYALTPDQAQPLTLLDTVPAVERANVLQALARVEKVA